MCIISALKFVCNFSGWAGRISIYKIRVDKKCDVFFQKQNGESNTDPAIILRRLHNLSARQARWLIPEKIDIRQDILISDFISMQKAFFASPSHLKMLEVTLKWCSLVHICGKLSPKSTLSLFSPPLLMRLLSRSESTVLTSFFSLPRTLLLDYIMKSISSSGR